MKITKILYHFTELLARAHHAIIKIPSPEYSGEGLWIFRSAPRDGDVVGVADLHLDDRLAVAEHDVRAPAWRELHPPLAVLALDSREGDVFDDEVPRHHQHGPATTFHALLVRPVRVQSDFHSTLLKAGKCHPAGCSRP